MYDRIAVRSGWKLLVELRTGIYSISGREVAVLGILQAIEAALDVPRVKAARIRFWHGRKKGFPGVVSWRVLLETVLPSTLKGARSSERL